MEQATLAHEESSINKFYQIFAIFLGDLAKVCPQGWTLLPKRT